MTFPSDIGDFVIGISAIEAATPAASTVAAGPADLSAFFGGDLALTPGGDLATAAGSPRGLQRVLRRLMTNPGDYPWQIAYGAGLPAAIGTPARADALRAVITSQMMQEPAVARTPAPAAEVRVQGDGAVFASIRYVDAETGASQSASFGVTR